MPSGVPAIQAFSHMQGRDYVDSDDLQTAIKLVILPRGNF